MVLELLTALAYLAQQGIEHGLAAPEGFVDLITRHSLGSLVVVFIVLGGIHRHQHRLSSRKDRLIGMLATHQLNSDRTSIDLEGDNQRRMTGQVEWPRQSGHLQVGLPGQRVLQGHRPLWQCRHDQHLAGLQQPIHFGAKGRAHLLRLEHFLGRGFTGLFQSCCHIGPQLAAGQPFGTCLCCFCVDHCQSGSEGLIQQRQLDPGVR
ncbi:hypothetical protein D3C78_1204470 [compost metagenome]